MTAQTPVIDPQKKRYAAALAHPVFSTRRLEQLRFADIKAAMIARRFREDLHRVTELTHPICGAITRRLIENHGFTVVAVEADWPDLAGSSLPLVRAPTLLLVGILDGPVIGLNQQAFALLTALKELVIVEGARNLFEEPGTLDQVIAHASRWLSTRFGKA